MGFGRANPWIHTQSLSVIAVVRLEERMPVVATREDEKDRRVECGGKCLFLRAKPAGCGRREIREQESRSPLPIPPAATRYAGARWAWGDSRLIVRTIDRLAAGDRQQGVEDPRIDVPRNESHGSVAEENVETARMRMAQSG